MKTVTLLTGTAALLTALAAPAFAQTEISAGANATGVSAVNDRIDDIEDDVQDDFDRANDVDRFGPADRRQGLFGTMSLSYTGRTGNTENQDLAIAGRVSYNKAPFAQSVSLGIEFGEDDNGNKDQEEVSGIYDAQYYFNDRFYAFALGRFTIDGLIDNIRNSDGQTDDDLFEENDDLARDGFLGFGPGYRVLNTQDTTWRVQAGVGIRYTQTGEAKAGFRNVFNDVTGNLDRVDSNKSSDSEIGYIVSSRLYHRFNENIFVTNDTDILSSDANDLVTNEFGVNFKLSEQLATRASYTTEYQSDRDTRTDNTLGLAIVYGF